MSSIDSSCDLRRVCWDQMERLRNWKILLVIKRPWHDLVIHCPCAGHHCIQLHCLCACAACDSEDESATSIPSDLQPRRKCAISPLGAGTSSIGFVSLPSRSDLGVWRTGHWQSSDDICILVYYLQRATGCSHIHLSTRARSKVCCKYIFMFW